MLLLYGIGKQNASWHVLEAKAPMYARIYLILGGNTVYHEADYTCALQKGHLYLFPVHIPYELTTDPEDPIECLYLHLDLLTANLWHLVDVPMESDPQLKALVDVIREGIRQNAPVTYLEPLSQALGELCRMHRLFEPVSSEAQKFIGILRQFYRTDTPLSEISARMGYSTEYFIRLFKKHMGVSPYQYMVSLRMSDSVRMLHAGWTLDRIAEAIGYSDGHNFSIAFRHYYGISPRNYRRLYAGAI